MTYKILFVHTNRMTTAKDRMRILKSAVSNHHFSAKQIRIMVKFGEFTKDKLDILGLMAPMLHCDDLDAANDEILKGFKYEDDKKMASELLMNICKK
mgnify:CR=1 FL=1|jgi:hypothetical protein